MVYPLPGMNPFLEHPAIWPQVHKRLIVAIADAMNPLLRPKYRMEIEERVYTFPSINEDETVLVGIPDDVVVQSSSLRSDFTESRVAVASPTTEPVTVTLPIPETVKEWYLEVKQVETEEVITVIGILSPKNKKAGEGRRQYLAKRQVILGSLTHLIEIDLLRQGQVMPMDSQGINTHYRILVSRSYTRPQADLYAFNLQDVIPSFPLPLKQEDADLMINLQSLLEEIYKRGSYDLVINYRLEPVPRLTKLDSVWLDEILKQYKLR